MKLALVAVLFAAAACGGSKPAPTTPTADPAPAPRSEPMQTDATTAPAALVAAEKPAEPAPPPPPPPSLPGWYASADASVELKDDGTALVEARGKKAGKAAKGKWDSAANTLTIAGKTTPVKLDGDSLVVTVGGAETTLPRQPTTFDGTTFADDNGSLQLNADGTCLQGKGGIPEKCTYKLAGGKLALVFKGAPKLSATWPIYFDAGGKVMHTPKQTLTSTAN
jgi:hypothetical protein